MWVFGLSHYAVVDEETLLCATTRDGRSELVRLSLASGRSERVALPFELGVVEGVRVRAGRACFLAAGPRQPLSVFVYDLESGVLHERRASVPEPPPNAWISVPEAIEFPSEGGRRAHAYLYPPTHPEHALAPGEAPPLLLLSHGGRRAARRTRCSTCASSSGRAGASP